MLRWCRMENKGVSGSRQRLPVTDAGALRRNRTFVPRSRRGRGAKTEISTSVPLTDGMPYGGGKNKPLCWSTTGSLEFSSMSLLMSGQKDLSSPCHPPTRRKTTFWALEYVPLLRVAAVTYRCLAAAPVHSSTSQQRLQPHTKNQESRFSLA